MVGGSGRKPFPRFRRSTNTSPCETAPGAQASGAVLFDRGRQWVQVDGIMARNWWSQTVYPPRYFCGFLETHTRRIELIDAPIVPLSRKVAAIIHAERGGCYYKTDLARGRPRRIGAIQYAISVVDPKRGRMRIEKFRHEFEGPCDFRMVDGCACLVMADGSDLYAPFPLGEVFDRFGGVTRPVLQFVG